MPRQRLESLSLTSLVHHTNGQVQVFALGRGCAGSGEESEESACEEHCFLFFQRVLDCRRRKGLFFNEEMKVSIGFEFWGGEEIMRTPDGNSSTRYPLILILVLLIGSCYE